MIVIDFETRSRCDLKVAGTAAYVADPSTDILCLCMVDMDDDSSCRWRPGRELPDRWRRLLETADFVAAHYAEFDQGIYEYIAVNDYGFPELPRDRWYCTAAQMRVNAIPAGLADAAWCLGVKNKKFDSGAHLIKKLSIPREDGTFLEDHQLMQEMEDYCMGDVLAAVDIVRATRPMTQNEHEDWLKTCEINETGIKCDLELATLALRYADAEKAEIGEELSRLTWGTIDAVTQSARIKHWIVEAVGVSHPLIDEMTVYKKGEKKLSLDKNIRSNILDLIGTQAIDIPDEVAHMIELLDEGSMSSVAKFKRMLERADPTDHRVRGAFVFAGASQTLRFASRGLQLHNMKRDCWSAEDTEILKDIMRRNGLLRSEDKALLGVMDTLAKLMRPTIIPADGNVFVVGDWSSIEARGLHYLTDTQQGDEKLDLFESGADVYMKAAEDMGFDDRQTGKVAELACGYQGGYRALQVMARNYGVKLTEADATDIVAKWRAANWWVVQFWADLNEAAMNAISNPGEYFTAGLVKYIFVPELIDGTLICVMPGDHMIQYPKARIDLVTMPWGDEGYSVTAIKAAHKPKADAKEWPRTALYGGLFCENICQAFTAAILRRALRRLSGVVAHVHDEIVLEVPNSMPRAVVIALAAVMNDVPEWADGLPLDSKPVIMYRYGK